jgi:hypothetical protein
MSYFRAIYELEKVVKKEDLCGRLQPTFDRTEVLWIVRQALSSGSRVGDVTMSLVVVANLKLTRTSQTNESTLPAGNIAERRLTDIIVP